MKFYFSVVDLITFEIKLLSEIVFNNVLFCVFENIHGSSFGWKKLS